MALSGISHGGQNDTFNKVVACGQKAKPLLYAEPSKAGCSRLVQVQALTSNPAASAGAIKSAGCYLAWARLEMVATFAASRLDGERAAKRNEAKLER